MEARQSTRGTGRAVSLSRRRDCLKVGGKRETGHVWREGTRRGEDEGWSRTSGYSEVRVHSSRGSG